MDANEPMSDFWQAVLLGVIEGVTEFLPISSTGHLLIAQELGLDRRSDMFNVVIQAGAILAVTMIYWQRLWQLASNFRDPANRDYLLKLFVAFMVTAVLGLIVTKLGYKLPATVTPIAWALIVGGIWILIAEWFASRKPDVVQVTWTVAIVVGLAQIVAAIFPGTSRSAAAIFAAMLVGTSNRPAAAEFVFLVGIPTMFAASGAQIFSVLRDSTAHEDWGSLAIAFVSATLTGFLAVKFLLGYIKSHRFTIFAIYRIVLGVGLLLWLPAGM
jgi:undecaprenyl-diphosphatase